MKKEILELERKIDAGVMTLMSDGRERTAADIDNRFEYGIREIRSSTRRLLARRELFNDDSFFGSVIYRNTPYLDEESEE